jgi:hypothetical protein
VKGGSGTNRIVLSKKEKMGGEGDSPDNAGFEKIMGWPKLMMDFFDFPVFNGSFPIERLSFVD